MMVRNPAQYSVDDSQINLFRKINSIISHLLFLFITFLNPIVNASDTTSTDIPGLLPLVKIDNTKTFSEKQVIESMLPYRRKLQSLETNVEIAKHRYQSSGWMQNPELRLSDISNRYRDKGKYEYEVGLRFRIPELGEMGAEKQEARVELWRQKVEHIRETQNLIIRLRQNYADVLLHDELAKLSRQRVIKENERISKIETLLKIGSRSIVYFTKSKMRHADSKNDYARAVQNQSFARRTLARRGGIPENAALVESKLPEINQELYELITLAIKNRPEIELVDQRIELAVRQKRYEIFQLLPWPDFIEVSHHKEKDTKDNWNELRMGIKLPVFNWNFGNIKATNLAVKKKQDGYDAIRELIEDEVRTAYSIYMDLLLDWKNFKHNAEELIDNARMVIEQAHHHEILMPDEVMEMELTIIETKKLLAEKRCDLAYALYGLYYTIGIIEYDQLFDKDMTDGERTK